MVKIKFVESVAQYDETMCHLKQENYTHSFVYKK